MADKTPTSLRGKVAQLALDYPEHRTALVKMMREARWIPEEFRDDTFNHGRVVPDEIDPEGTGSQVPPPRNNDGKLIEPDYDAERGIQAVKKAHGTLSAAQEKLLNDSIQRLSSAGFQPKTTRIQVRPGHLSLTAVGELFDKSGTLRNSDEVRQVVASTFGVEADQVDLIGFAPRWEYEVG
jgi:hypothetical protein